MPTKVEKTNHCDMLAEPIGISVKALFDMYGPVLTLCSIRKSKPNGQVYYDLYNEDGEMACCDGEECVIEEDSGVLVTFLSEGTDGGTVRFTLTHEELAVATFQ